jgi:hypothetical protein
VLGALTAVVANEPAQSRRWLRRLCSCGGAPRPPRHPCGRIPVDPDRIETPDLATYSQEEELAAGRSPSWNSPDIVTNDWGPFRLMPEAHVTVRNISSTPATNVLVHYFIAPFGIGFPWTLLQTRALDLPAGSAADLLFPLDQATLGGDPRVGVNIRIEHPHDQALLNNVGAQVHDGSYTSEVGYTSSIQIPVLNDSNFARTIELAVAPSTITATVTPTSRAFAPHEQINATLQIQVPAGLAGQHDVTVVARLSSGELVGGVTKLIRVNT